MFMVNRRRHALRKNGMMLVKRSEAGLELAGRDANLRGYPL